MYSGLLFYFTPDRLHRSKTISRWPERARTESRGLELGVVATIISTIQAHAAAAHGEAITISATRSSKAHDRRARPGSAETRNGRWFRARVFFAAQSCHGSLIFIGARRLGHYPGISAIGAYCSPWIYSGDLEAGLGDRVDNADRQWMGFWLS